MGGFSSVNGDPLGTVMNADNVSFDGTSRGGVVTTDGQLLIGSTTTPHIRVGSLTSTGGTVTIQVGHGTINLESSGFVVTSIVTQVFTSSGVYTPTLGMVFAIIECIGGGGAGGGSATTGGAQVSGGSGGGAGEYAKGLFSAASVGVSQIVTIGAGGTGNAGAAGGNGGTTSVGALITAFPGIGGATAAAAAAIASTWTLGGTGGAGGDFRTPGQPGQPIAVINAASVAQPVWGAAGGSSQYGAAGLGVSMIFATNTGVGAVGLGYGTGGGGSMNRASQGATLTGAAGAPGIVYITEYI